MKRVIIFTEKLLPVTQTFIRIQVNALKRFSPQYVGLVPAEPSFPIPDDSILLTGDRHLASLYRKELYKWVGVAPDFHRAARRANGSLIHAHFCENGPAALSLSTAAKLPLILHLRGGAEILPDHVLGRKLWSMPYLLKRRRLFERASLFLCVSEFIRRKAIESGFPEEKLCVHYTGIDLSRFVATGETPESDLVLYVGRLIEYKGATHVVKAMEKVRQSRPKARVVFIGDGPLRPALEKLSSELHVPCEFLGTQPSGVIRTLLSKARVLCAPSMTLPNGEAEAFGNVFTEAQAMGVPVVSYQHGGIPEAVLHGETGLLAPEGNYDVLAQYIIRYLTDEFFWQFSRKRGMEWSRANFDVYKQTEKLELIYDRVLANAGMGVTQ